MKPNQRLLALDVFRGITIASMILVNNPGSWATTYWPLLHAEWHGVTPTDWIFAFFLFIVGAAIPLALDKRLKRGDGIGAIARKIGSRTAIIFGLGLFLTAFPHFLLRNACAGLAPLHYGLLTLVMVTVAAREILDQPQYRSPGNDRRRHRLGYAALAAGAGMVLLGWFAYDLHALRIPGVLQRIAVVYGICALLYLCTGHRALLGIGIGLLLFYWALMTLVPVPGGLAPNLEPETNLSAWLDHQLLGPHGDPEGLLSTLPAVATGIAGMLTGVWLQRPTDDRRKLTGLFAAGALLLGLSLVWNVVLPINKRIWTSSYVLHTGGIALVFLGLVYWLVDLRGCKGWIKPFVVFGVNPLFAYVLSGVVDKLTYAIRWETAGGATQTVQGWMYENVFLSWLSPYNASLGYALLNVLFCLAVVWVLYWKRIFIKV